MKTTTFGELKTGEYFKILGNPQRYVHADAVERAQAQIWVRMDSMVEGEYPTTAIGVPLGVLSALIKPEWAVCVVDVPNMPMQKCEHCGNVLPECAMDKRESVEYPWDGSDTEGSIGETVTHWRCMDRTHCRNNRRATSKLMQSIALHNDASLREGGAGAIGGGAV